MQTVPNILMLHYSSVSSDMAVESADAAQFENADEEAMS